MDLAPLRPREFWILTLLAEGDLHGYGLMKAVERESEGRVRVGAATLYRTLDDLHERGWIGPVHAEATGRRARRPWALTESGRGRLRTEADRLAALGGRARRSLGG